jgi:hypothetical protein
MSVALEEAPPPFMTESQRNYDTVSQRGKVRIGVNTLMMWTAHAYAPTFILPRNGGG